MSQLSQLRGHTRRLLDRSPTYGVHPDAYLTHQLLQACGLFDDARLLDEHIRHCAATLRTLQPTIERQPSPDSVRCSHSPPGMTLRALDLFCGGGGAALGLIQAGYDVTGVDINPRHHRCTRAGSSAATHSTHPSTWQISTLYGQARHASGSAIHQLPQEIAS